MSAIPGDNDAPIAGGVDRRRGRNLSPESFDGVDDSPHRLRSWPNNAFVQRLALDPAEFDDLVVDDSFPGIILVALSGR